ncbi:hypothetical protein NUU61_003153 [Penicillium alfredii]|uniref:Uncharacterized protein n=1 Tax=Penicillium alfredii TaxID=1506179 RepID=A0A9W9FST7_9EURO|nr:uncharacterized protein NUU61_003153 [Penicillium alfredii]KAJ5105806.1 hypothetical protein NUU61_003153 [Penicillium alfredii]
MFSAFISITEKEQRPSAIYSTERTGRCWDDGKTEDMIGWKYNPHSYTKPDWGSRAPSEA